MKYIIIQTTDSVGLQIFQQNVLETTFKMQSF